MLSFLPPDVSAQASSKPARKASKPKPAELSGAQVVLQLLPKFVLQPTGLKLSLAEALGGSGADIPMGPTEHSPATDIPDRVYASTISDLARSLNEAVQPRYKDAPRTAEQKQRWKEVIERDQVDVKARLDHGFADFNQWVDHWYSTPTELDPVPPRWRRQLQAVPDSVVQVIAREMAEANRQQDRRGEWDKLKLVQLYVDPVTRTRCLVVTYHKDGYGHDHYAVKLDRVGPFAFDYPQGDPEVDYAHLTRRGDLPARDHHGWLCAAPMIYLSGQRWAGNLPWAGCDSYHASSLSDFDRMRRAIGEYLAPYHQAPPPAEDFIPTANWPHIAQGLSSEQVAPSAPSALVQSTPSAPITDADIMRGAHDAMKEAGLLVNYEIEGHDFRWYPFQVGGQTFEALYHPKHLTWIRGPVRSATDTATYTWFPRTKQLRAKELPERVQELLSGRVQLGGFRKKRNPAAPTVQQVAKAVHQLEHAVDEPERLTPAVLRVLRAAGWREGDPVHDPRVGADRFDVQAVVSDLSVPGFDLVGAMWR